MTQGGLSGEAGNGLLGLPQSVSVYGSECIIAVNKNDTAPIFEIADYGICGDLFKVTPMLIEAIKAARSRWWRGSRPRRRPEPQPAPRPA